MNPVPHYGIPRGENASRVVRDSRGTRMFDPDVNAEVPVISLPPDELVPRAMTAFPTAGPDWGVVKLGCPEAHKRFTGKGVKVCVLDTGASRHPDYGPVLDENIKSFVPNESADDGQGHSAHCMGRVLARGVEYGVAPGAIPMFGKVLSNAGSGAVTWIAAGIRWAADNGADVISMSLGGPQKDPYIPPALDYARSKGCIIVAAMGNEGPGQNTFGYPGGYPQCIAVGATDRGDVIASFSSRGPVAFVAAPGVQIRSQYIGNRYADMSGTSMATPHVAGAAALWCEANPDVPRDATRHDCFAADLKASCLDLGPAGRDTAYGWGRFDAAKLVAGAVTPPPVPPVVPPVTPPPVMAGFSGTLVYENGVLKSVTPKTAMSESEAARHNFRIDLIEFMRTANRRHDGNFDIVFRLDGPIGEGGEPVVVYRTAQVGKKRYATGPNVALCGEGHGENRADEQFVGEKPLGEAASWLMAGSTE